MEGSSHRADELGRHLESTIRSRVRCGPQCEVSHLWICVLGCQVIGGLFFLMGVWNSTLSWSLFLAINLTFANCIGILGFLSAVAVRRFAFRFGLSFNWPLWVASMIAGGIVGMFLAYSLNDLLWGIRLSGWTGVLFNLVMVSLLIGIYAAYIGMKETAHRATEELRQKELREIELLRLQTETELKALQSAIEPHFLFNALNSIASLTAEDPARAEQALIRLSELLRLVIESSQVKTIPLERELAIVRNYLEIERIRFEERLSYRIDVASHLLTLQVPGLLLQPLVENAVKHGVSVKRSPGEVMVRASSDGTQAVLEVSDDGEGTPETTGLPGGGLGLDNIRQRLLATYGERARLELQREEGLTSAKVVIPLPEEREP